MNRPATVIVAVTAVMTAAALAVGPPPATAHAAAWPDPAKAIATWKAAGKPHHLIIVREATVELVDNRGVVARLPRPHGTVTMDWLADRVQGLSGPSGKDQWIARPSKDTVTLSAALLLGGGTALHVGTPVKRLLLAGGADRSRAAWIRAGRARITIDRAQVHSWNPATGRPVAAGAAGRPYLKVGDGGRLDITGAELGHLGASGTGTGITWGKGATGAIRGSVVLANHIGLALTGSDGVVIDEVEVIESAHTGVLLRGDARTRITEVTADAGGGDGLHITGGASRTVSGVRARRNRSFGVTATAAPGLVLEGTRTGANGRGGVLLADCRGCLLGNPGAFDEPVAVQVTGAGSTGVRVIDARIRGGSTGIRVGPRTREVTVGNAEINGTATGLALSGRDVEARGGRWRPARTGAVLHGKASGVRLTGVTIEGGVTGVMATRTTSGAHLTDLTVTGVSGQAVNSASPGLVVTGGHISGAATGLALRANATLTGTRVDQVARGLRAILRARVAADRIDVAATDTGIAAERGARVTLTGSRVRAAASLRGDVVLRGGNTVVPPSFPWLGFVAVGVIAVALILHTVHRARQGRALPVQAPAHVLNQS
ncbi:right-handed parallel beta-helix repeat-containing protein [Thermopolyspora sp. NPDC052614]|uniref:right-handed parallel beta-helix repeat-containing protein n=1 Tax=Thermopolyspora sp. NPDC052614 TaxID=3155682 RepID=UPI0034199E55